MIIHIKIKESIRRLPVLRPRPAVEDAMLGGDPVVVFCFQQGNVVWCIGFPFGKCHNMVEFTAL